MKALKKIILLWLPPIIWASIIFMFSAHPSVRTSEIHWQDFIIKKSFHFFIFAVLCLFLYRAFRETNNKKKSGYLSFFITSFYGATDEIHQSFTSGREPALRDFLIDSAGALFTIYLIYKYLPKLPEKIKNITKRIGIY